MCNANIADEILCKIYSHHLCVYLTHHLLFSHAAYSSFLQSVRQSSAIETLSVSELDELEDEVQGRGSTPAPLPPPAVSVAGGVDESESGKGQEVVAIGREEKSREGNMLRLSARRWHVLSRVCCIMSCCSQYAHILRY